MTIDSSITDGEKSEKSEEGEVRKSAYAENLSREQMTMAASRWFKSYIKPFEGKLCKDCESFVKKHKAWDESKVPEVALIDGAECKKCKMTYDIYKGMIFPVPIATPEEAKEIERQLGKWG